VDLVVSLLMYNCWVLIFEYLLVGSVRYCLISGLTREWVVKLAIKLISAICPSGRGKRSASSFAITHSGRPFITPLAVFEWCNIQLLGD